MNHAPEYLGDVLRTALQTGAAAFPCPVRFQAEHFPDRPAIRTAEGIVTYAELDRAASRAALPSSGRIALTCGNTADVPALLVAVFRRQIPVLFLGSRLPTTVAAEAAANLDAVLIDPAIAAVVVRSDDAPSGSDARHCPAATWSLAAPATSLRTSGSTGQPRNITHTLGHHLSSAASVASALELRPDDSWLWSLPVWHVGGLSILFRMWIAGGCVAIPTAGEPLRREAARLHATRVSLVAAQLEDWLSRNQNEPGQAIRDIIVGGGPVPAHLLLQVVQAGLPIRTTYGSTETASMVTLSERRKKNVAPHAGKPLPGVTIEILEDGRIRIGAPSVALAPLDAESIDANSTISTPAPTNAPTATTAVRTFIDTADRGRIDEHGNLHVLGRLDDVFISGGENVDPAQIEYALLSLPGVTVARVVPVPDPRFGKRPVAFVALAHGKLDETRIRLRLRDLLPGYMIPVHVLPLPPLPVGVLKWSRQLLMDIAVRATRSQSRRIE